MTPTLPPPASPVSHSAIPGRNGCAEANLIARGQKMGPRILLADAHGIVRQGLRSLLRGTLKRASFVETETAAATVEAVRRQKWQLIILELDRSDGVGIDPGTLAQCGGAPILVFTLHSEAQMGVAAIEAGASGYLCKTATAAEILTAVTTLLAGRKYFSPKVRELLAEHSIQRSGGAVSPVLSTRERAVLREFDTGSTMKEIAAQLGLASSTVGTYRTRILRKLGLRTTNELLRHLAEHRLNLT